MKNIQSKLQEKLKQKFSLFMEVRIDGSKVSLMPTASDIPTLKIIKYDSDKDVLEIMFETTEHVSYEDKYDDALCWVKSDSGKLLGIRFLHAKEIGNKKVGEMIKALREEYKKIEENEKVHFSVSEAINSNYEKRKLSFFKDVIRKDIDELVCY